MSTVVAVATLGLPPNANSAGAAARNDRGSSAVPETMAVYNAVTGAKLGSHRLEGSSAGTAVHPTGIYSSRTGKSTTALFVWGRESPLARFAAPEPLGPIAFTHKGAFVIAGSLTGMLYIWEASTGTLICGWKAHYRKITCLSLSDDDTLLASGSEDAMIHVWDITTSLMYHSNPEKGLLQTISSHKVTVTALCFGAGGIQSVLASSSLDHTCRVFNPLTGQEQLCVTFPSAVLCVDVDPAGFQLFCGSMDGTVFTINIQDGKYFTLRGHTAAVTCVKALPQTLGGPFMILSGSDDATLRWWDPASRSPVRTVKTEGSSPLKGLSIVSVENPKSGKKRDARDPPPLKKLKDDEESRDRFIIVQDNPDYDQEVVLQDYIQASTGTAMSRIGKATGDKDEARWETIATQLYELAADRVYDEATNGL